MSNHYNVKEQIASRCKDIAYTDVSQAWRGDELSSAWEYARTALGDDALAENIQRAFCLRERVKLDRKWFVGNEAFVEAASERIERSLPLLALAPYIESPERLPKQFKSNTDARDALVNLARKTKGALALAHDTTPDKIKLTVEDAINIIIRSGVALTKDTSQRAPVLYVYDYDRQLYTTQDNLLRTWLTSILGVITPSGYQAFYQTLESMLGEFAFFNRPPKWLIAVGNGMYDTLNNTLLPNSPIWTVTRRISTRYQADACEPSLASGVTFDKLVDDLANHNERRSRLVKQMCKTIVTGHSPKPACFIIVGRGGDGKSLFMKLMSRIVGPSNTGNMSIKDLGKDDVLYANADAALVIGFDNDARATLSETSTFKSFVTNEPFAVSRKYLSSISIVFSGALVQLCNGMPRIFETGASMRRRIVVILAENSHYEASDEIEALENEINDTSWHEYILRSLLDPDVCPFYTDYEDIDREIMSSTLDADDIIGQFINELIENSIITPETTAVPVSLMYALYCDWMAAANPNSAKLGARSFGIDFKQRLEIHGFKGEHERRFSLKNAMQADGCVLEDMLAQLRGAAVDECLEQNVSTRVLIRTGEDHSELLNLGGKRHSEECSAEYYFSARHEITQMIELYPLIVADLVNEHLNAYEYTLQQNCQTAEIPAVLLSSRKGVPATSAQPFTRKSTPKPMRETIGACSKSIDELLESVGSLMNKLDSLPALGLDDIGLLDDITAAVMRLAAKKRQRNKDSATLGASISELLHESDLQRKLLTCKRMLQSELKDD